MLKFWAWISSPKLHYAPLNTQYSETRFSHSVLGVPPSGGVRGMNTHEGTPGVDQSCDGGQIPHSWPGEHPEITQSAAVAPQKHFRSALRKQTPWRWPIICHPSIQPSNTPESKRQTGCTKCNFPATTTPPPVSPHIEPPYLPQI